MPPKGHDLDVRVSFDPDYEDMVAEIYLDGHCIALISQDEGRDRPTIEIYSEPSMGVWKLPLARTRGGDCSRQTSASRAAAGGA